MLLIWGIELYDNVWDFGALIFHVSVLLNPLVMAVRVDNQQFRFSRCLWRGGSFMDFL